MQYNPDKPIIAGNWKMNGLRGSKIEIENLINFLRDNNQNTNVIIFPPYTLISDFMDITVSSDLSIGSQNCHQQNQGAYTGSISPEMIKDLGCNFVLIGHSEIRNTRNESSILIGKKSEVCHRHNLTSIICVGEDAECRMLGKQFDFISNQLFESIPATANINNTIIAYEPVWAIGAGKSARLHDIELMHNHIKKFLNNSKIFDNNTPNIIYGGSVNTDNSREILSINNVNGALVGGGSLDSKEFIKIIQSI
jgi:triosephosphate isomerase